MSSTPSRSALATQLAKLGAALYCPAVHHPTRVVFSCVCVAFQASRQCSLAGLQQRCGHPAGEPGRLGSVSKSCSYRLGDGPEFQSPYAP